MRVFSIRAVEIVFTQKIGTDNWNRNITETMIKFTFQDINRYYIKGKHLHTQIC